MRTDELGNTYNLRGEKIYKRFEVKPDAEPLNDDMAYLIYDNETMIVISYISKDEIEIGLEVVSYLNGLNSEIKYYEKELKNIQDYMGMDKSELVEAARECKARRQYEDGLHKLEIKHAREVLATCISLYPDSKGLWDFKSTMAW